MRFSFPIAVILALAACNSEPIMAPERGEVDISDFDIPGLDEGQGVEAIRTNAADGGPPHGTFKITTQYDDVFFEEVRADGTFVSKAEDGRVVETGTWRLGPGNQFCSMGGGSGATEVCFVENVDENGVWTSYDPELDEASTIERMAPQEP